MWLVSAKHCQWEPLWYLERCRNPGRSVLINPNISRRVGRPLQRARACAVSTAVVRGSRGPRAVSKFHLCVRRSGVFGVEMKTLPCYAFQSPGVGSRPGGRHARPAGGGYWGVTPLENSSRSAGGSECMQEMAPRCGIIKETDSPLDSLTFSTLRGRRPPSSDALTGRPPA